MDLQHIRNYVDNFNDLEFREDFYSINEEVDDFKHNILDKYIGNIFILAKIYVNETHKKDEFISFNDYHEAIILLSLIQLFEMFYDRDRHQVTNYEKLFEELNNLLVRFYTTMPETLFNALYILGYSKEVIDIVLNYLDEQVQKNIDGFSEISSDFEMIDEGISFEDNC